MLPFPPYRRLKQQKLSLASSAAANPQTSANQAQSSGSSSYPPTTPKHKTSDKADKADKQSKRPAAVPFHHRQPLAQEAPPLEQDSLGGSQLSALVPLEPPLEPLSALPGCKYPKPLSNGRKAPEPLLHSPMSPLPPTLSPHPRGRDPDGAPDVAADTAADPPVCVDGSSGAGSITSETAVYKSLRRQRENAAGWWKGFRTPRTDKAEFGPPELPYDKLEDAKGDAGSEGTPLKR